MTEPAQSLPFAALSTEQATQLFRGIVADEVKKALFPLPKDYQPDALNARDAAAFLTEIGYPTSVGNLYNTVAGKGVKIPYKKIGKRLVFSRADLAAWVAEKTIDPNDRSGAALALASSARRKK